LIVVIVGNGVPIALTTTDTGRGETTGAVRKGSRSPSPTRSENGTRNFTEAANHKRCLTDAAFDRNRSVTSHTAAAKNVDCQR
jgi:hypothetical protein